MKRIHKITYGFLIALTGFLALTTLLGGIGLMANTIPMPVEMLQGSVFKDYTIPGLALFAIVGGCASFAAILLAQKSQFASRLFGDVRPVLKSPLAVEKRLFI